MKKFFTILLALAMTFALSATAFAQSSTGTITIANPQADKTYEIYKIFDAKVVPNSNPAAYSYTIQSDSVWFNTVKEYANMPEEPSAADENTDGLTLKEVSGQPGTWVVIFTTPAFNAADFAAALNKALKGVPEVPDDPNTTENEHQDAIVPTITGVTPNASLPTGDPAQYTAALPYGYYFVTTGAGTVCSLDTNFPDVTIYDKNEKPPFDKTDDDADGSVYVGQVVNYTITGKVPATTGYTTYTWKVTDTMSEGLTFNKDVKVTVGSIEYIPTSDELKLNDKGFELNLNMVGREWAVGAAIKITYSATVNEKAVQDDNTEKNHATLEYSNNPGDSNSTTTTPPEEEIVYTGGIVIDKYAANPENQSDQSKKLAGAKFVLYKEVEEGGTTKKLYYKFTAGVADNPATTENEYQAPKTEWIEWDHSLNAQNLPTIVETDKQGHAEFQGLENGTYYVEEIEAPEGYNPLADPIEVTINVTGDSQHIDYQLDVPNSTGSELPETGGIGTTIFYIIGGLLMVGAVVLLVVRKKMSVTE